MQEGKKMEVSIIIPTYNRTEELKEALESIIAQTKLPKEVLIVDDSEHDEIQNLVKQKKNEFEFKGVTLKYIRNEKERSLAIARNIGIEHSTGDIVLFLDDDVILDREYIMNILRVYKEKHSAIGVQGYIINMFSGDMISKIRYAIGRIFFLWYPENDKCRVQPSAEPTYPSSSLKRTIECQWLAGSNCSFKREILQIFKFNENLKRYSWREDVDLSYRIYKIISNSLYITPHAKLIHKGSKTARLPKKQQILMQRVYISYFFYKNIDQCLKNKLIFLLSMVGELIIQTTISIIKPSKPHLLRVKYLIESYIMTLKHIKEIKKGDLEFFNKSLK